MKQNKKTLPAELSYYGLYLLDYLRKYHPDKVSDTDLITEREEAATVTFEKERLAGGTVEHAHEEAMRVLLRGLHFSPYALLTEVVEREFADEVPESGREAFCRDLYPYLKNLFAVTIRRTTPLPCRLPMTCSIRYWWEPSCFIWRKAMAFNRETETEGQHRGGTHGVHA